MALTLATLLTVRIGTAQWLRPLVVAPRTSSLPLDPDRTGYGSGETSCSASDRARDTVLRATCPTLDQAPGGPAGPVPDAARREMHDCVARIGEHYHEVVTYQPGDRYWTFQWWELALFLLGTAALCGYAGHRLRRLPA